MRIISGKYKSLKLKIPGNYDIRPTQDRVKESIFNVLSNDMDGSKILDLFAGSGSLGIEGLSRGAKMVYFIDSSTAAIQLIKENISLLKDPDFEFKVIKSDVADFIRKFKDDVFDFIFVDPPYSISEKIMQEIFVLLKKSTIYNKKTMVIYEYFSKRNVENEINGLKLIKKSHFGDKIVTYLAV